MSKNENYWDKKNVHFDGIKLSFYDASDQESLVRNFTDGAYSQARLYPTSSNFNSVEKQYKDNIFYTQHLQILVGLVLILTVSLTTIHLRRLMLKKIQLRKLFLTRTSVNQLTLLLTVQLIQHN